MNQALTTENPKEQPSALAQDSQFLRTTFKNRNSIWCRVLVQQLQTIGVKHAVLCIGGRSAALATVFDTHPDIDNMVFNDERSGAFYALGLAKMSKQPVAICTTSGSAVANLLPALVEAYACKVPLILLTCDRPTLIRHSGAPQCTDHLGLCGASVEAAIDLPDPDVSVAGLISLKATLTTLFKYLSSPDTVGPLHINIPQHGQATSTDPELDWTAPDLELSWFLPPVTPQYTTYQQPANKNDKNSQWLRPLDLRGGMKGLIVIGPDAMIEPDHIKLLAEQSNFPVVADVSSELRRPNTLSTLIWNGDIVVSSPGIISLAPDIIIRVGEAPISQLMQRYLESRRCPVVLLGRKKDTTDYLNPEAVHCPTASHAIEDLANALATGDQSWTNHWLTAADSAQKTKEDFLSSLSWSECLAARKVCMATGFSVFHAANSMSIRHANVFCDANNQPQRFLVNRGVSGIDGTISTFLGALQSCSGHGLLLMGDQAAAHDIAALHIATGTKLRGTICIMNNEGSAIFDLLSCHTVSNYTHTIRNKPNMNFERISAAFDIAYRRCTNEEELISGLDQSLGLDALTVLEICVPPGSLQNDLPWLYAAMRMTQ
ncbi:2-succinyl-5-enolpyruvyl-6-hydroxy-3-cyclohexene-1-carboxylic-acid synthase [Gammaproteobacteria bacterium 45_16_T64]|nr:2-succinyl-5-enolpyruvyl-6-hydroxy-3-cyclohexene-1-carboxylic-acid synthase [Gammaproteobacteria bacterium 45_16_T64]